MEQQPDSNNPAAAAVGELVRRIENGYHERQDYPPFAPAPWDDRGRYLDWVRRIAAEYQAELVGQSYPTMDNGEAGREN